MIVGELNRRFRIPDHAEFEFGHGKLPMLRIRNDAAEALISLYGGQVLSYRPTATGREMLFLSERAHFHHGKAIKGGIPICWPWFGPSPDDRDLPAHGLARIHMWSVREVSQDESDTTYITLGIDNNDDTRAIWPHEFKLRLHITVGETLRLELETTNTSKTAYDITQALHTYFSIGHIFDTHVEGLTGKKYLDKAHGGTSNRQDGSVRFEGEVDAVYANVGTNLAIIDAKQQRRIEISTEYSDTAVVWNPWAGISYQMSDLDDDAFKRFVCVETANTGDEIVHLQPAATAQIAATYRDVSL